MGKNSGKENYRWWKKKREKKTNEKKTAEKIVEKNPRNSAINIDSGKKVKKKHIGNKNI